MKKIVLNVEGMMCGGCEARVKKTLLQINGIEEVVASFEDKKVEVLAADNVDENSIVIQVEDLGFEVKK